MTAWDTNSPIVAPLARVITEPISCVLGYAQGDGGQLIYWALSLDGYGITHLSQPHWVARHPSNEEHYESQD